MVLHLIHRHKFHEQGSKKPETEGAHRLKSKEHHAKGDMPDLQIPNPSLFLPAPREDLKFQLHAQADLREIHTQQVHE